MAVNARFPREVRLRKRPDFLRVQRRGRRTKTRDLVVCWSRRPEGARFGLTVSRKVGNAVVRNRVKRWLREAIRTRRLDLPDVDVVVIARTSASSAGLEALQSQIALAFERIARMEGAADVGHPRREMA